MRVTEAKYVGDEQIVVILQDLPYSEIFDRKVEEPGPPMIDKRTGVVILSYDLLDYSRYAEPNTMPYSEAKHHYPWQAELAGTEKQIRYFLHIYFPTWSTDGDFERSGVWDRESVARAAGAAERSGAIIESSASNQVSKMLEAKYAKDYTAMEAFERYEELIKHKRVYGNVILEDHEYGEVSNECYAQMWGWITNVDTAEQAIKEAHVFAREVNVPYTGIDIDAYHPEPYRGGKVFATWIYVQDCPGIDQHYEDPLGEARYYKTPTASEVYDRMEDVLDYSKHIVDTPVVSVMDFGLGSVNHSIEDAPEVAYVELLVKTQDKQRAKILAQEFLDSKNVPYHDIKTEYASDEETYVHAQWVDPITEAKYHGQDKDEFSWNDRSQVYELYKKQQTPTGVGADPFIQTEMRFFGGEHVPEIQFWFRKARHSFQEADREAVAFMRANRLPYTSKHYDERRFFDGPDDSFIIKFYFGHPHDYGVI